MERRGAFVKLANWLLGLNQVGWNRNATDGGSETVHTLLLGSSCSVQFSSIIDPICPSHLQSILSVLVKWKTKSFNFLLL